MTRKSDQVSLAAILAEVRRRVPQGALQVSEAEERDPFDAMIRRICCATNTMEHRVLARLLRKVVEESTAETTFRLTEIAAFSPAILSLLSAFIDDYIGGRYDRAAIRSELFINGISPTAGTKTPLG